MDHVNKVAGGDWYCRVPSPGQRDHIAAQADQDASLVSITACLADGTYIMDAAGAAKLRTDSPAEFKARVAAGRAAMAARPAYSGPVRAEKTGVKDESEG